MATGMRLKQLGALDLVQGLYAMCPYIAGKWPQERFPSSVENNGILLDLHNNRGAMAYGIEAFERQDPMAWPSFAAVDDVAGQRVLQSARRDLKLKAMAAGAVLYAPGADTLAADVRLNLARPLLAQPDSVLQRLEVDRGAIRRWIRPESR